MAQITRTYLRGAALSADVLREWGGACQFYEAEDGARVWREVLRDGHDWEGWITRQLPGRAVGATHRTFRVDYVGDAASTFGDSGLPVWHPPFALDADAPPVVDRDPAELFLLRWDGRTWSEVALRGTEQGS